MTDDAHCYAVKTCPRCGAVVYADMQTCYDCLFDFGDGEGREPPAQTPLRRCFAEPGVELRCAQVDVWRPVPPEGIVVGRDARSDVVLHSTAVSTFHLHLCPTPDGMEATDLGSRNPAVYKGRKLRDRTVVPYGDSIDLCGAVLVMTGPEANGGEAPCDGVL